MGVGGIGRFVVVGVAVDRLVAVAVGEGVVVGGIGVFVLVGVAVGLAASVATCAACAAWTVAVASSEAS